MAPLRCEIRQAMEACRQSTLTLFSEIDYDTFCHQAHPDFSPIGWHLGHIAYTEALWLLEHAAGAPRQFPQYCRLFAADSLPKTERRNLPTLAEVIEYLNCIRSQVFDYLESAPLGEQERLWRWLLQHESQHCETIAIVLALHHLKHPSGSRQQPAPLGTSPRPTDMVQIPAGEFVCGSEAISALDNERPAHTVHLEAFWIDQHPVTWGQYRLFMQAEGYQEKRWWSAEGWQWLQAAQVTHPLYWPSGEGWQNHPVMGVSWYEADAYARFVGKRLPTEAEWEKAARWQPASQASQAYPWGELAPQANHCNHGHGLGATSQVDRHPEGASPTGCWDLLGNVWEWTASWFAPYEGFAAYPYRGYSEAYFDQAHRVLRGGSWATRPWALRSSFRNWYHPHVREIFAGFRCARDGE